MSMRNVERKVQSVLKREEKKKIAGGAIIERERHICCLWPSVINHLPVDL